MENPELFTPVSHTGKNPQSEWARFWRAVYEAVGTWTEVAALTDIRPRVLRKYRHGDQIRCCSRSTVAWIIERCEMGYDIDSLPWFTTTDLVHLRVWHKSNQPVGKPVARGNGIPLRRDKVTDPWERYQQGQLWQ